MGMEGAAETLPELGSSASCPKSQVSSSALGSLGDSPGVQPEGVEQWPLCLQEAPPTLAPHSCAPRLGIELRTVKSGPDYLFDIPGRFGGGFVDRGGSCPASPPQPGCGVLAIPWDPTEPVSQFWQLFLDCDWKRRLSVAR